MLTSTCIYIFLILEFLFFSVFTFSDGFGFTLSSQRWAEKYWKPINSFGYRDVEHLKADFENKRVIFVVGDSIAAGHGINSIENRFSDILQRNLGSEYLVVNIAKSGWDTGYEYDAIVSYPYQPNRIILEYVTNDIEEVARKAGTLSFVPVEAPQNSALNYVVSNSYSFNFVYWRIFRASNQGRDEQYWRQLKQSYANPDVWRAHVRDLDRIVEFAQKRGIGLTVVVFPNLGAVKDSAEITSKVSQFFKSRNVMVLNLEPILEGRDSSSLVVNSLDAHPNEALNKEVAELLTRDMLAHAW